MGSFSRYIFRTTFGAFLIVLFSLTAVIWFTQAMRNFDLMTNQGQTILVFLGITALIVPMLVMIIAPIALVVAVAHMLNKLGTDSEIIVMNAAGTSPWQIFRPFFAVAVVVSIIVAAVGAYISPKSLRELRHWAAEVRADILTNIVQPGRFTTIEDGLITFHIRDRQPNGLLVGIFVDDRRIAQQRVTYLAEKGEIVKNENGAFLVLEGGSIQRHQAGQRDLRIVSFERNAFDLSRFTGGVQKIVYSAREKYLWELLWPDPADPVYRTRPEQFRSELHDRIAAPIYPLLFVVITYACLGAPQTTRQNRAMSLAAAIGAIAALRTTGFVSIIVGMHTPWAVPLLYVVFALATILGLYAISRGKVIAPPAFVTNSVAVLSDRLSRRAATT